MSSLFFPLTLFTKKRPKRILPDILLSYTIHREMESAQMLRRTMSRLAQEVAKSVQRISVNAMLDLSHQIKRSRLGTLLLIVSIAPLCVS